MVLFVFCIVSILLPKDNASFTGYLEVFVFHD